MFDKFFNRKENNKLEMDKVLFTDENQLDTLLKESKIKPVLLFKHSTSCGISAMVLNRFENNMQNKKEDYHYYFLDLLRYRNISNLVAKELDIMHQSPQLIVIKNGKVEDYASHYGIIDIKL